MGVLCALRSSARERDATMTESRAAWPTYPNKLNARIMATLKELCSTIPASMMRDQAIRELNRRKAISYARRMDALRQEERVFDKCQTRRPEKGKSKNSYSREEAGTVGSIVVGVRTSWNSVVVCKCKKMN